MLWAQLISRFLPPLEGLPPGQARRARKLVVLLLVLMTFCGAAMVLQLAQRAFQMAAGTGTIFTVSVLGLLATKRGVRRGLVVTAVLTIGLSVAGVMAVANGRGGYFSSFWMLTAPLIAMGTGGRRAGWATLGVTAVAMFLTLLGIEQRWVEPVLELNLTLANRTMSMLGATVLAFLLMRAYEAESEASIHELEGRNHELLAARAEAERASRAKSDFLATISHEIRTPLNGVTGMAAVLSAETEPARVKEGLALIKQSADTLLAVINDVLDFSKIEADQLELEAVPVCPAIELQVVVSLLGPRAEEGGNTLSLHVAPGTPAWVRGDPIRLRQVVLNLVSNAVKFTSHGSVEVRASAEGNTLVLAVKDSGIGLTPEAAQRLFQPFTQADASTTRRFGGTGLGLVICARLVAAMGGTIGVESAPGRGSTFTVRLPFVAVAAPADVVVQGPAARRREVLLVEDNAINQVVATRLLERLGHHVTVAGDGQQALALFPGPFDLVLMDCHMPVMDGFETTRALRARGCTTPIIALTAAVTTEDRERCLAAGMTSVLSKPLKLEQLVEAFAAT